MRAKAGPTWPPEHDFPHLRDEQQKYNINPGIGADSHFGGDYRIGLELGWGGLLAKVRRCRAQHGVGKAEFYQAEEDVIIGIQDLIRRTVRDARVAADRQEEPELRENLVRIAEMNEWLIDNPPRTMREACQWLAWFNIASRTYNRDGAGGQLDEILRRTTSATWRPGSSMMRRPSSTSPACSSSTRATTRLPAPTLPAAT